MAPRLAAACTVVAVDLRGYGDSAGPAPDPSHAAYSPEETATALLRFLVERHDF